MTIVVDRINFDIITKYNTGSNHDHQIGNSSAELKLIERINDQEFTLYVQLSTQEFIDFMVGLAPLIESCKPDLKKMIENRLTFQQINGRLYRLELAHLL